MNVSTTPPPPASAASLAPPPAAAQAAEGGEPDPVLARLRHLEVPPIARQTPCRVELAKEGSIE